MPSFAASPETVQAIAVLSGSGWLAAFGFIGTWKTTPSEVARIRGRPASNVSWLSRKRSVLPAVAVAPRTRTSRSKAPGRLASSTAPVRAPGTSRTIRGSRSTHDCRIVTVDGSATGLSPTGWSSARV